MHEVSRKEFVMKRLLTRTPTTEHSVEIGEDYTFLIQQTQFDFSLDQMAVLERIIQEAKDDPSTRHTYTDHLYTMSYEPANGELEQFIIRRPVTGRMITMTPSTAYKLLEALTGKSVKKKEK